MTSPAQNRANILSPSGTGYIEPKAVFDAGLGPVLLGALDITGGPAPTAEDDLGVIDSLDLANQYELRQVRSNAGAWSLLRGDDIANVAVAHGNPIVPHAGSPAIFAFMRDDGTTNSLHAWSLVGTSAETEVLTSAALADGSQFICGIFDGPNADVMAWVPGQSTVIVGRVVAAGPAWTLPVRFHSDHGIAHRAACAGEWTVRLAGARAFSRRHRRAARLHARDRLLVAAANLTDQRDRRSLRRGADARQCVSTSLRRHARRDPTSSMISFGNSGSGRTQTGSTELPALKPLSIFANVMMLDDGLFRRDNVKVQHTYQFGDWGTSAISAGAGPFTILAQSGNYGGPAQGIGTPLTNVVGTVSSAPAATAVNQMHAQFSIFNFNSSIGPSVDAIAISPLPGTYTTAQQITFSGLIAGTTVYLRINGSGVFQAWNPASPPWLTRTSTVEYYASRTSGASPTQTAQYTFSVPPAIQDSDGDGVPDFVEIAYGMNPSGGGDTDGDGFSDNDELAAGTNPNDALSKPASQPPALDSMLVDVRMNLLTPAGGFVARAAAGTAITIHDPFGNALGSGVIGTGAATASFGRVSTVGVDASMAFLVVRGSTHFTADPAHLGFEPTGRELIGLVPALEPEVWSWGVADGGIGIATAWGWGGVNWVASSTNWNGALGDMQGADANWSARLLNPLWDSSTSGTYSAAGWVSRFQAAMNRGAQPYAEITLTPYTSIEALIVGKIVGDMLAQRNPTATIDGTTLDFADDLLSSFQSLRRTDPAHPTATVARIVAVHRHVHDQLAAADVGAVALEKNRARCVCAAQRIAHLRPRRAAHAAQCARRVHHHRRAASRLSHRHDPHARGSHECRCEAHEHHRHPPHARLARADTLHAQHAKHARPLARAKRRRHAAASSHRPARCRRDAHQL